ncbi:Endoribonuclease L-PSP/chorismate mutase-like protein [Mariannaea sp. PMI_226]|nr:Endoribonuclease L-PSP/chorismate mutase-like protein [Mariannaea sp. PMI_226]
MEYTQNSFRGHGLRTFDPQAGFSEISNQLKLSQAIVIPPNASLVVTSGQCGFKDDLSLPIDGREQIMLAWENAEKSLRAAGVTEGWKNVYQMTTYTPNMSDEWTNAMMEAKSKYMGNNRPAWTGVTVPSLYGGAIVEMTLYAFIPPNQGA